MTLDEAIQHAEEVADKCALTDGNILCENDHRQLAEWLTDYKRLLEQEPCEDAISRQAALDEIISRLGISGEKYLLESERYIYQIIKDLPPVTPKQRTGHWQALTGLFFCSVCDGGFAKPWRYCPNCGAKMESEEQTEYHGTEDMDGLYYCPICQQTTTVVKDGKCPKCGATMDELSTREQTEDAISRQAAINSLIDNTHLDGYDLAEALDAIENKEKLPSATPKAEPCDDAISRTWLKKAFHNYFQGLVHVVTEEDVQAYIDVAPSVTPKQRTGHWQALTGLFFCSVCDGGFAKPWRYCPNCGAKMESEGQA